MRRCNLQVDFTAPKIIFNEVHVNPNHVINTITLITKQFIFRCKCKDTALTYNGIVNEIKQNFYIEMYNVKVLNNVKKMAKKWSPVRHVFHL